MKAVVPEIYNDMVGKTKKKLFVNCSYIERKTWSKSNTSQIPQ